MILRIFKTNSVRINIRNIAVSQLGLVNKWTVEGSKNYQTHAIYRLNVYAIIMFVRHKLVLFIITFIFMFVYLIECVPFKINEISVKLIKF